MPFLYTSLAYVYVCVCVCVCVCVHVHVHVCVCMHARKLFYCMEKCDVHVVNVAAISPSCMCTPTDMYTELHLYSVCACIHTHSTIYMCVYM